MTVAIRSLCFAGLMLALAGCAEQVAGEPEASVQYLTQGGATAADCPAGTKVIVGTAGNDVLSGTVKRDCILGLGGDDVIEGGIGDDVLFGGSGNDTLRGGAGDDALHGEAGDDGLFGNIGRDQLLGGAGDDFIEGGVGDDEVLGGDGNDVIEGGTGDDVVEGGLCHDSIMGEVGKDVLAGNAGADRIDDGIGNDTVNGGAGPDACNGTSCEQAINVADCDSDDDCTGGKRCVMATGLCASTSEVAFSDPTCDGLDEDCDGDVDEEYVPTATSCGVGACAAVGEMLCAGGETFDSCEPGEAAASDATCDGIDDDCDGAVDEDYASEATSCGEGLCAGAGMTSCVDGLVVDDCQPAEGTDDGNPCTVDSCDPVDGDVHTAMAVGTSCSDGDECNGEELCMPGMTPFMSIDPRATYLRSNLDTPVMPVSLALMGLSPGDVVTISVVGAMKTTPADPGTSEALAVFSSSATVLTATNRVVRVPGALQSDAPLYVSPNTLLGNLPTDIPQDFKFDQAGVTVTIPVGATHIITGAVGNFYGDNTSLPGSPFGFVMTTGEIACTAGEPPAVCE